MDWLFEHNNAEIFIEMISNIKGKDALTKPPIRHFVSMMWSRYQPRIVSYVFFPYLIYLALICVLSGSVVDTFMKTREQLLFMKEFDNLKLAKDPHYDYKTDLHYKALVKIHQDNRAFFLVESIFLLVLIVYFGIMELKQYREAGVAYFFDAWNLIDATSLCLNFSFGSMFFICVLYDEIYFPRELILSIASWAMLFMWLKVFYWFRLYSSYAYYVRLII